MPTKSALHEQRPAQAEFNTEDIFVVSPAYLENLKAKALQTANGRYRVCLHSSTEELVQNMVIVLAENSYVQPHRQRPGKSKAYHVMEGQLSVVLWNDKGEIDRVLELGAKGTGLPSLYHLSKSIWHMPVPMSSVAVYQETSTGPFVKNWDVEYSPWAPAEENISAAAQFLSATKSAIKSRQGAAAL